METQALSPDSFFYSRCQHNIEMIHEIGSLVAHKEIFTSFCDGYGVFTFFSPCEGKTRRD
jgi:hypothetical protein